MNQTDDLNNSSREQIVKKFEQQGIGLIQAGQWQSYFVMLYVMASHGVEL